MIILTIVLFIALANGQVIQEVPRTFIRSGRYSPQLFGSSGRYRPDDRGRYIHVPVPYDGGYGDTGREYVHDIRQGLRYWEQYGESGRWEMPDVYESTAVYASGPYMPSPSVPSYLNDNQLQYAEDYDYDTSGWRIIQFQWSKDGKTRYSYLYETENKILAEEIEKLARLYGGGGSESRMNGLYTYKGDDGTVYTVKYIAKEEGNSKKEKHPSKSIQKVLDFLTQNATQIE